MLEIVGQSNLRELFRGLAYNNAIPQFIILEGNVGSGKRLIAEFISELINANLFTPNDLKIDSIRQIIEDSRNISSNRLYLLADSDTMTRQAQNALLKLAEEPPKYEYIVATVEDRNTLLPTILSRAKIYRLDSYTKQELEEFTDNELKLNTCQTPGQILNLTDEDAEEIHEFANKVINNIDDISIINLFNICRYLDIDGKGNGYPLTIFFNMLLYVLCGKSNSKETDINRAGIVLKYKRIFVNKSLNKQMGIDAFLLELKGVI